jgi:hypothetical protein
MDANKIIFLIILILFYSFCYSQDYWESIYCSESSISCLAINSIGYLFTGTQNGTYRSIDNGNVWEYIGLENISVYCLTINSNNDIFAGTGGYYNIYRSIDNGTNWTPQNSNTVNIISLTINSYGDIFAGSGGDYSIIRSIDNGSNWELVLSLSDCETVYSIVENSEGVLFVGTTNWIGEGGGVYRSTDQGDSWEHIGLEYEYISSLAINSNDEIFAGSRGQHYEYGGGIFRSSDNGETWTELRDDVLVTSIAIDSEEKIFIGCSDLDGFTGAVHFSEDNGESWQLIESEIMPPNIGIEFITISEDDYIYAISYGGQINDIYRSVQPTGVINDYSIQNIIDCKFHNYPNPFNPQTTISYDLPDNIENPIIEIFNIKGEKVRSFNCQNQMPIIWDGIDNYQNQVSSGVYLYRIKSDEGVLITNKMLLLK